MESFLILLIAALMLGVPYFVWGLPGLAVAVLLLVAFHVGYRVGTGKWMKPL